MSFQEGHSNAFCADKKQPIRAADRICVKRVINGNENGMLRSLDAQIKHRMCYSVLDTTQKR